MPNFANKSRVPPMDGAMLTELTRARVQSTANASGQQTSKRTLSRGFAAQHSAVSSPALYRGLVSTLIRNEQLAHQVLGQIGAGEGSSLQGYDWMLYDSLGRIYTANSDLTSFTLGSTTTAFDGFGCSDSNLQYESSTGFWYTGGISSGKIHRSTNGGSSWTQVFTGAAHRFLQFSFTPTAIYAQTYRFLYKSTNGGTSWTAILDTVPPINAFRVLANGTTIVVSGGGVLYASLNQGTTWTGNLRNSAPISTNGLTNTLYIYSLLYFNNKFWTIGNDGSSRTYILSSPDAVTWTVTFLSSFWSPREVVRNPVTGLLVAQVGFPGTMGSGMRWSSDDGLTWTNGSGSVLGKIASSTAPVYDFCLNTLHFNGSRYIVRMFDGTFHTSTDGKAWTALTIRTPVGGSIQGAGVKYTDPTLQLL